MSRYVRATLGGRIISEIGRLPVEEYTSPLVRVVSVVAHDSDVVVADAKSYEVRTYDLRGRLLRILRADERLRTATDSAWNTALRGLPAAGRARAAAGPRQYPAFAEVRVDSLSRIWIHDYHERQRWTVFDHDGALLGNVQLPVIDGEPSQLVWLGRDELALRHNDANGAIVLTFHRLVRPGGAGSALRP